MRYEVKRVGKAQVESTAREGRFKVSVLKMDMVKVAPESMRDFVPEVQFSKVRACIQYSTFRKLSQEWNNQQVWCDPSELVKLRDVLNEIIDGAPGEGASASSCGGD